MKYISMILLVLAISIGKSQAYQQTLATLRGTVTDRDGLPLPGALIYLRDTQYRTITNEEGEFELEVAGVDYTLVVSYIGMKTMEIPQKMIVGPDSKVRFQSLHRLAPRQLHEMLDSIQAGYANQSITLHHTQP
ncbi:carboxypeptidase-like regulatory domain-containing protein [uncultured Algoriphagus sp.]|uniref:carboxypeptidase-like regulatory domain-containing protein n=1 Tax=uncultured Algoriphagus sp. TaxID=417365 RepID=UPI0030EBFA11